MRARVARWRSKRTNSKSNSKKSNPAPPTRCSSKTPTASWRPSVPPPRRPWGEHNSNSRTVCPWAYRCRANCRAVLIEVQNADGAVVLVGRTPDLRFGGTPEESESELSRPEGAPDEDADGKLELRQEEGSRQIKIEVDGLLPETTYDVILSDPATSEVLGTLTTKENGSGTLCIDTVAGDALPFGVGDLDELAGLTVSVVDSDGAVVLTGQVGVAKAADRDNDDNNDGPEASGESCLVSTAADNATRGKVEVKRDGSKFELEVEVRGLAPAAVFEVNLSSAAGESAVVGSLVTSGRGRGELEIEGSLPLGVATVEELTGATLTITDADGMAVLTGITPALGDRADCGNEDEDKKGVLLTATGGTLYLDNVEAISLEAQTKLLRVLAEKTVRPVGGEASVDFDARCIASSQRELRELFSSSPYRIRSARPSWKWRVASVSSKFRASM